MNEKVADISEISVRLSPRGVYTWTITTAFETKDREEAVEIINRMDGLLRDKFPNHASPGTGRVVGISREEEDY